MTIDWGTKDGLRQIAFHTLGIIPIEREDESIHKKIANLTSEEVRKAKRKFRKLWKKISKRYENTIYENLIGKGAPDPDPMHMQYRKRIVLANIERWINKTLRDMSNDAKKIEGEDK